MLWLQNQLFGICLKYNLINILFDNIVLEMYILPDQYAYTCWLQWYEGLQLLENVDIK